MVFENGIRKVPGKNSHLKKQQTPKPDKNKSWNIFNSSLSSLSEQDKDRHWEKDGENESESDLRRNCRWPCRRWPRTRCPCSTSPSWRCWPSTVPECIAWQSRRQFFRSPVQIPAVTVAKSQNPTRSLRCSKIFFFYNFFFVTFLNHAVITEYLSVFTGWGG